MMNEERGGSDEKDQADGDIMSNDDDRRRDGAIK